MTGWIFALAAATAHAAAPAPPVRLHAIGTATVAILQEESIDPAKPDRQKGTGHQTRQRGRGVQIDFY